MIIRAAFGGSEKDVSCEPSCRVNLNPHAKGLFPSPSNPHAKGLFPSPPLAACPLCLTFHLLLVMMPLRSYPFLVGRLAPSVSDVNSPLNRETSELDHVVVCCPQSKKHMLRLGDHESD